MADHISPYTGAQIDEAVNNALNMTPANIGAAAAIHASQHAAGGTDPISPASIGATSLWELLWTNASPSSAFAAQTIAIDLSGYEAVLVECSFVALTTVNRDRAYQKVLPIGAEDYGWCLHKLFVRRPITVSPSGVTFGEGIYYNTYNTTSTTVENAVVVPMRIYGIEKIYA